MSYLYVATDSRRKSGNHWFLGVAKPPEDKVKTQLELGHPSACVDFIVKSTEANQVFEQLKTLVNHEEIDDQTILVEGHHDQLAQLVTQTAENYEKEHPSLKRSVIRWLDKC